MSKYEDRLRTGLKDLQQDLDKENAKKKKHKHNIKEKTAFDKLPNFTRTEFWCDHCDIDFVAPAYKMWIETYLTGSWHSFCPLCNRLVYRHITSKTLDPYYNKSDKIKMMRGEALKDMLQPGQYGFRTQYGDPFEHYYKKFQHEHEMLHNKYAEMGLMGKTLAQKEEESDIINRG